MEDVAATRDETAQGVLSLRLLAAAGLAGIIVAIALLLSVQPNPAGLGTHHQLRLPPCGLLTFTGVPCPSCGVTTSMAHMARLQVLSALRVQPFGVVAFAIMLLSAVGLGATIIQGRGPMHWLQGLGINWSAFAIALGGLFLLSWIYKIIIICF